MMTTVLPFETSLPWPVLERGTRLAQAKTLQYLLRAHGYAVSPDGVFGQATETAVRAFQADHRLAVDGAAGPATWRALIIRVKLNSRGDAVRGVQQEAVNRDGSDVPSLVIDGVFGPRTDQFVRGYQASLRATFPHDGVVVDGVVGPTTWRALVNGFVHL
jgi:peptidoglycan hydrolase-like protein with peptidoglycan-binding domain